MALFYSKNFFEKHKDKYDYYSDVDYYLLKKNIPKFNINGIFLDMACGSGVIGEFFKKEYPFLNVVGIDTCPPLLKWSKNNKCLSDAKFLPFKNGSLDCIVAVAAFHHFKNIQQVIKECVRCLKKDGVFLCVEPNKYHMQRFLMMTNPLRYIFYRNGDHAISSVWFKRVLERNALQDISVNYISFKGKKPGILSRINYFTVDLINKYIKLLLIFFAPWFIISAVKK